MHSTQSLRRSGYMQIPDHKDERLNWVCSTWWLGAPLSGASAPPHQQKPTEGYSSFRCLLDPLLGSIQGMYPREKAQGRPRTHWRESLGWLRRFLQAEHEYLLWTGRSGLRLLPLKFNDGWMDIANSSTFTAANTAANHKSCNL